MAIRLNRLSNINDFKRFIIYFIITFSLNGFTQSFPELITIEEIVKDKELAQHYYNSLQTRFKNGNFDDILFAHHATARGRRFTQEDYENMLRTLNAFVNSNPDEIQRFREIAPIQPFKIQNSNIETISEAQSNSWNSITTKLQQISHTPENFLNNYDSESAKKILADIKVVKSGSRLDFTSRLDQENVIQSLVKHYARKKDQQTLKLIADLLIQFEAATRMDKFKSWGLPGYLQYSVLEDIEKNAIRTGKNLGVPGKLLDSLLALSSLGTSVEKSNFFRKGTTFVPMSRFEATFKGIGPGECVRASCGRYFDSLMDDSFHIKILKDGKETGYIGIIKTVIPKTNNKVWFIETIQSPFLSDSSQSSKMMRGLLRHLQQQAILDNSLLAIPSFNFNTFNYKEVPAELKAVPEVTSNSTYEVDFQNSDRIIKLNNFFKSSSADFDQRVAKNSGYKSNHLINGIFMNNGKVTILDPLMDQPDWFIQRSYDLLTNKSLGPIDYNFKLPPLERAQLVIKIDTGFAAKEHLYQLAQNQFAIGKIKEAEEIFESAYEAIPENLRRASFKEQFDYVENRVKTVRQTYEFAQKLKDELMFKAKSWEEYKLIIELGDKGSEVFTPFILSTLDRFSADASSDEMFQIFKSNLKLLLTAEDDYEFARLVVKRLNKPEEFINLLTIAAGDVRGAGSFADKSMIYSLIIENWERFHPKDAPWEQRRDFAEKILLRSNNATDLKIRQRLLRQATSFSEIFDLSQIANPGGFKGDDFKEFSSFLSDAIHEVAKIKSVDELLADKDKIRSIANTLSSEDKKLVNNSLLKKVRTLKEAQSFLGREAIPQEYFQTLFDSENLSLEDKVSLRRIQKPFSETTIIDTIAADTDAYDSILDEHIKLNAQFNNRVQVPTIKEAVIFENHLKKIMLQPLGLQKLYLETLSKTPQSYSLVSQVPHHASLIDTLNAWNISLKLQGIEATEILAKRFNLSPKRVESPPEPTKAPKCFKNTIRSLIFKFIE